MGLRKDGIDTVFFERELNKVLSGNYDVKYADLKGRTLVATNRELQPGDKTFTWIEFDRAGIVKLVSAAANDLPRADVKGTENTGRVDYYANAFGYNVLEVLAAQRANRPLQTMKATAARKAHDENMDKLVAIGDTATGAVGLLNQPNFQLYTVPAGAAASATWALKTADEILADMNGIVNKIRSTTKGVHRARRLVIPIEQYTLIATKPRSSTSDTTILEFFLKNNPGVTVEDWYRCDGAGAGGTDRMVAYDDSPDVLAFFVAQEFQQFPVQEKGLEFEVPCMSGAGGVVAFYPLAGCYGDGI
jgi:hypothetical protein